MAWALSLSPESDVNHRALRYFIAVAEEGAISRAALRLRVAQPALSLHVRNLEAELGTELLHRTARGVTTTESGCRLLRHARDIIGRVEAAKEDVRSHATSPVGDVVLGTTQSIAKVLAVPLYRLAKDRLPGVSLRFSESSTGHMPALLRQRQMDLVVLFKPQSDRAIHEVPLLDEDLFLVGPRVPGEIAQDGTVSLADALRCPLLLPGRPHSLRELLNDCVRREHLRANVVAEIDAVPQLKDFVEAGLGHTILTLACVQTEVESGRLNARRIVDPAITRRVLLCRSAELPPSRAAAAVETLIVRLVEDLVRQDRWPGRIATEQP